MSDAYLFEKEGNDSEIERLEDLLSVYRIGAVVPMLATPATETNPVSRFGWFRLGYAVAVAALAVTLVSSGVYFRYLRPANVEMTAISPIETPAVERDFGAPTGLDRAAASEPAVTHGDGTTAKPMPVRRITRVVDRRSARAPANISVAANTPRLTKEEQYAYDQLKVALWITGSKLRVVKDTIDRVDDKPETANEKR